MVNPMCCVPACPGNCCIPYDEYLQSTDGKILRQACDKGDYDTVKLMTDKWKVVSTRSCCLVNPISEGGEGERLNSVHIAALRGQHQILRLLLDTNRIDVDQYTFHEYSNFHDPCNVRFSKLKHRTAVHIALATGHVECLKLLIDHGGANLMKPLYKSDETYKSSIDMLSRKYIEDMITWDDLKRTQSRFACSSYSNNSPSSTSTENKNPIIISSCDHNEENIIQTHHPIPDYDVNACLSLLESHGFIFNNRLIEFALDTAFRYNNHMIFELFSKRDTTNHVKSRHYLHHAIKEEKNLEMIHSLLRLGVDVNGLDAWEKVAAFYACK
jgi:ankyrin repeat protein